jgi:serine/threonine protein kinase
MATGKPPFSVKSWKELTITLTPTYLKNYPYSNALTPPLLHLLKHIFIHDYSKRLKTEELLSHPFFTNEPLPATLPTEKSEEFKEKKAKSSRSKATFRSLELK